ncbi:MAG TPA: ABC transporter substrate-binding protein [Stellaceae bacterium]|nr:ABC transporter substrate-binding protein [Stellaceae bacterium]
MRRRDFIAVLCAIGVAWPTATLAQQRAIPAVGFVSSRSAEESAYLVAAFHQGLSEGGYREGTNVAIEYRWAEGRYDRLPDMVADLVRRQVAVIVSAGGMVTALAVKATTTTIPAVFISGGIDPVKAGLVQSLAHPGANLTGVSMLAIAVESKLLQLAHEILPNAAQIAVLVNPNTADLEAQTRDFDAAAKTMGLHIDMVKATAERDFDAAFDAIAAMHADALIVAGDPFFTSRRERIAALAGRARVPAIYDLREYVAAGGLISYGPSLAEGYRQAGRYAGQILKGAKPADLPIMQATRFELVINLKTAKALGLEIPPSILARADEVIE